MVTGQPIIKPFEASNPAQQAGMRSATVASVLPGPGKIKGVKGAASYLAQRAKNIAGRLSRRTQTHTTTAVAEVINPNGTKEILVASSEKVLRPQQLSALTPGETAVSGIEGHAETTILKAAEANSQIVSKIAASRPVCPDCADALQKAGVEILTPLKKPF